MKVMLKRFGQEVAIEDPSKVVHTLVFDIDGREESIPTGEETIKALVTRMHSAPAPRPRTPETPEPGPATATEDPRHSEEDIKDATEFGGDGLEQEEVPAGCCPNCRKDGYEPGKSCGKCGFWDGPESEEEVGSL
jgi:hypothetical protein